MRASLAVEPARPEELGPAFRLIFQRVAADEREIRVANALRLVQEHELDPAGVFVVRDGKETVEARYYISSLEVDVKQFARAVRGHWGIENGCHWVLDMTFREDESRIRERHLRENFAWLNRFALSLLKQHPGRQSLVMKRRSCGWSDAFLVEVVTGSTC